MAGGISAPFIRFPIATSLVMVGLGFVGIIAYPQLPVAPLPQVDFPTIQVTATLPGGDPTTMASSVAQRSRHNSLKFRRHQMTSTSSLNSTSITIQFDLDRNIDAWQSMTFRGQASQTASRSGAMAGLVAADRTLSSRPGDWPILAGRVVRHVVVTSVNGNVPTTRPARGSANPRC